MSEVIENHATSMLPGGLFERTFMSEPIENHAISKLSAVDLNNHQCEHRRRDVTLSQVEYQHQV